MKKREIFIENSKEARVAVRLLPRLRGNASACKYKLTTWTVYLRRRPENDRLRRENMRVG